MISLSKTIYTVPPQIRQKLLSGEYVRLGGVIRDKSSGKIKFLLIEKINEEKEGASISISIPEIMNSTLQYLTAGEMRKQLEHVKNELDAQNIQIKPDDMEDITGAIDLAHQPGVTPVQMQETTGNMLKMYERYRSVFSKYAMDLDRPKYLQSFPFSKILILIAVYSAKICLQSKNALEADGWIGRVYDEIIGAMKLYCLMNSKTDADREHYSAISGYTAADFIRELKEIITNPPYKPKYKFPPMEVIYLWSCVEYLGGYRLELEGVS